MTTAKLLEEKIGEILQILNIPKTESNADTPKRVSKMLLDELLCNRPITMFKGIVELNKDLLINRMTTFDNPNKGSDFPITVKNIKFYSLCEHHLLPMYGSVDITYIPNNKILGLSKFPRVVKYFSKRPQLQERLTKEIGDFLVSVLNPKELHIKVHDVTHMCVMMRGVEAECETNTLFSYKGDDIIGKE